MRLPRGDEAVIPPEKLRRYALDPSHRIGRHKARVFAAVLGITLWDWRHLHDEIIAQVPQADVRSSRLTQYGAAYELVVTVNGLNGTSAPVVTTWIVEQNGPPRLTSTWVDIP
jgi:hypothetical protein